MEPLNCQSLFRWVAEAVEAKETGGKIAAAEEIAHGGEDIGTERPHGGTVAFFIAGK